MALNSSIERLQKRLEKDPNSMQFLQLVEEYRKEGMLEEALKACNNGLERHPNYWSARVALGRIHHQNGDPEKASEELEKVIQVVPDNLLANRLLADIYSELGQGDRALERYRIVQMITPADQEVQTIIQDLEKSVETGEAPQETVAAANVQGPVDSSVEEGVFETAVENEDQYGESVPGIEPGPEEEPAFFRPVLPDAVPAAAEQADDDLAEMANQFLIGRPAEPVVELLNDDLGLEMELTAAEVEVQEGFLDEEDDLETVEPPQTQDRTQPLEDTSEEPIEEAEELTSETLAELYAAQGLAEKAAKVYQRLLLNDPGNLQILQKLRELDQEEPLLAKAEPVGVSINEKIREKKGSGRSAARKAESLSRLSEERRRKINTLESWLHSIRRDRG